MAGGNAFTEGKLRSPARPFGRKRSILPGFGLTFGFTVFYLCLIVLIPLSALFIRSLGLGIDHFVSVGFSERAIASYKLSFGAALAAAMINGVFGLLIAWVLVRYEFPGKRVVGAMVDLPFALPTAVAGIALTALYASNGWIGGWLDPEGIYRADYIAAHPAAAGLLETLKLKVAYTPVGVVVALIFIGLPFVVRSVEPVLADLGADVEEAAASLGAGRLQTFRRVILPAILPALAVGEYGSVIFIAGNMPYKSEISPLLIVTQLEQYDYAGATAIATVMLVFSFALLLLINLIQVWSRRRMAS